LLGVSWSLYWAIWVPQPQKGWKHWSRFYHQLVFSLKTYFDSKRKKFFSSEYYFLFDLVMTLLTRIHYCWLHQSSFNKSDVLFVFLHFIMLLENNLKIFLFRLFAFSSQCKSACVKNVYFFRSSSSDWQRMEWMKHNFIKLLKKLSPNDSKSLTFLRNRLRLVRAKSIIYYDKTSTIIILKL
jgi:hypothetical protein